MTWHLKRWLALPLAAVALAIAAPAQGASIRDKAGMFDASAVKQADAELSRIERQFEVPVVIETIEALPDHASLPKNARQQAIDDLAVERDRKAGTPGIYILMAKEDRIMSHVLVPRGLSRHLGEERRLAIRDAFVSGFRKGDFNGGLESGVKKIGRELAAAQDEAGGSLRRAQGQRGQVGPGRVGPPPRNVPARGGSGWGALIGIVLVILAIVFVVRLLGSLFGGNRGYAGPMRGPGPMMGGPAGYGGGYGGPGGGGFFSNLMGGLGGALAGNWLYDRFSGRHGGGYFDNTAYGAPTGPSGDAGYNDNEIVGANDDAGIGGSWGDSGGDGGGDWGGGGDGGGSWGGGGGDFGGGDWGGGGGGGGDGGGSW